MAKVSQISERQPRSDASLAAMFDTALEISAERDKTEREIKRLAESGFRDAAWALLVKHLNIQEPQRAKR